MQDPRLYIWAFVIVGITVPVAAVAQSDKAKNVGRLSELTWEAAYTAEWWHNSGGGEDGDVYIDKLDMAAEYKFGDGSNWSAFGHIFYGNGNSLTDLTRDAFAVSNIESGIQGLQLSEAWVQGNVSDSTNIKLGFYDLNSEFDVLEASNFFIGSAHGIGVDISQTGENGPSIFPVTALAFRLQTELSADVSVRVAVIDGVAGGRENPQRPSVRLSSSEGALVIGELEYNLSSAKILIGGWGYTEEVDRFEDTNTESNTGLYVRGEREVALENGTKFSIFGRAGIANENVNVFSGFGSAGAKLAWPNGHELGAAIAHAASSGKVQRTENLEDGETAFELTYALPLTDKLTLQPNLQHVISPSASPDLKNATAVGLRLVLATGS